METNSDAPAPEPREIADANVERLLSTSYRPELPDPEFVRRVEDRMVALARGRGGSASDRSAPGRPDLSVQIRRARIAAMAALAAVVILSALGLVLAFGGLARSDAGFLRTGDVVWIDGTPYVPASDLPGGLGFPSPEKKEIAPLVEGGLAAGRRPEAPATTPAAVGDHVATAGGERRRLALPDGSTLYANERTRVSIDGERKVSLAEGELYLEVAPRAEPFLVSTPSREVAALGTKFGITAREDETRVVVTHGMVRVDGVADPLLAGQELAATGKGAVEVSPSPRASFLLDWTKELMAAAESPLVPGSEHAGGTLVAIDPWGQEGKLELRRYHVDVHIEDGFARTTIDQTYFNHHARRTEGTFYFPLPPGASLSRLAMYVSGKLMEGGMAERDRARDVYEEIVYRQKDPALLEWVDGSTFKMRVFPLEGRQEKRIVLSYTERLPAAYGTLTYRFPGGAGQGVVRDWSLAVRVAGGREMEWRSESHELGAGVEGDDLVLTAEAHKTKPDRDVVIRLAPRSQERVSHEPPRFLAAVLDGNRYFAVRFRPELGDPAAGPPRAERRHWVFLFESSGDREPLLARVQVELAREILANAEEGDTFSVLACGTNVRFLAERPLPATPENASRAIEFLERAHLVGALDLGGALAAAVRASSLGENPSIVHLGAGFPILGERREEALVSLLPAGARYVGIGVGKGWNRGLMRSAARATGGLFVQVNPDECVAWRALEILSSLRAPRLLDVSVVDDAERLSFLLDTDSLADGEELFAVARLPEHGVLPAEVTVAGSLGGKPWRRTFPVRDVAGGAGYLPRTWAKLEIDRLVSAGAEQNKDAIVALSKATYVMSPFTSLLVLESDEMYEQFGIDRGRNDHWALYPAPEEIPIVYEPDPSQGVDARNAPKDVVATRRPTASQILATIVFRTGPQFLYGPNNPDPYRGWDALTAEQTIVSSRERVVGAASVVYRPRGPQMRIPFAHRDTFAWDKTLRNEPGKIRALMGTNFPERYMDLLDRYYQRPSDAKRPVSRLELREKTRENRLGFRGKGYLGGKYMDRLHEMPPGFDGDDLLERLYYGGGWNSLLYQRPYFAGDYKVFGDLVSYCPGMNTSEADVFAVLEAEAEPDPGNAPGEIDPAARELLDAARGTGWRAVTIEPPGEQPFRVIFDGAGRWAWERTLPWGLIEKVSCDGETILALYPELGIGARRQASRFHRQEFWALVPQAIPPVEELARGADVRLVAERRIGLVPRGEEERFEFELPDPSSALAAESPDLSPDLSDLVVLPLPLRTREQVFLAAKKEQTGNFDSWTDEEALALVAADLASNHWELLQAIGQRFMARGDRRIGFYTLLMVGSNNWELESPFEVGNGQKVRLDPRTDHPDLPLARYVAEHVRSLRSGDPYREIEGVEGSVFLSRLAGFRALFGRWNSGKALEGDDAADSRERERALDFVRSCPVRIFAWAILGIVQNQTGDASLLAELAKLYAAFEEEPGLAYAGRYERARAAFGAGDSAAARELFRELHGRTLESGALPPLDSSFRQAFLAPDGSGDAWTSFVRETASGLAAKGRSADAVRFAWQVFQCGDAALAEEIVESALAGPPAEERRGTSLAAVEYLWQTGQLARAEGLADSMLAEEAHAADPRIWRIAAAVASQRGRLARSLACLERAMDLEYEALPDVIDLSAVRADYGNLLARYQDLANAMATLASEIPLEFVASVVRAADRWRFLDDDDTGACQAAASVLGTIGARELAWEYLTTPLAMRPNEAAPWLDLARSLRADGEFALADRAYELAFEAESTNAQILWDRAQNLQQSGRHDEALSLYRRIARGDWQPRFSWIQGEARRYLGGR
ncbi:MAG: FecR domain-containing protein [Planctomycetes bacterium]|nr:FecR domain-containing protein [Planctomycetota bacterium]